MSPKSMALLSTVALILPMMFFMMASPPLLILKHDTPKDARFIRGLFNLYYVAVMAAATIAALSQAFAGRYAASLAMAGVAVFAFMLRRWIVFRMDALRRTMQPDDSAAIAQFRRLHITGMLVNVFQLGAVAGGVTRLAI